MWERLKPAAATTFTLIKRAVLVPGMGESYPEIYLLIQIKEKEITKFSLINRLQTYFETAPFMSNRDGSIWVTGLGCICPLY